MEQNEHHPAYLAIVNNAKARVKRINLAGYMKMYFAGAPPLLIDTREESEWNAGHVAGAVHLSKGIIERDIEQRFPDKDSMLVLYCRSGSRSALVAENLQKMGYRNAFSLDGGWSELEYSGLDLEDYREPGHARARWRFERWRPPVPFVAAGVGLVTVLFISVLALRVGFFTEVSQADLQIVRGVVTDSRCGVHHSQPDSADCIRFCVAHGGKYVLASGKESYELSDQHVAEKYAGRNVRVRGSLEKRSGRLKVIFIEPV